ncbi:hypothetical protein Malapachy_2188 [Malassezia pachydermatis]|uniref:Uncharacterized protein n=1 Tax=Malassezia pachydermatis TaxID=77020 RepID=A0A0M8MWH9_9BASI|nr:hypothetical protein Malapachy_2188 [Malassezia pachydermatis]KOS15714.1 hypothetical protein Malapachy_2188 [Malassezia pachydermatis]
MTQGFKPLKRPGIATGKRKDKGSAAAKPKVGKRIAPKKQTALQEAIQKRKNTASSTTRIEKEMAGRAQKGPLTIMRSLANEVAKK